MIKTKLLRTKEFKIKFAIVCVLLAILVLSFFFADDIEKCLNFSESYATNQISEENLNKSDYKVTYLDVGQGNSTFIKLPDGKNMIIDGGSTIYSDRIVNFLNDEDVDKIDYLVATHADSDHIGGLIAVLKNFEVKNIFRPFQISGTGDSLDSFIANQYEDLADVYLDYVEKTGNRSKISRVTSSVYAEFIQLIYNETYFESGKLNHSKVTVFYDGLKLVGENYDFEFFAPFVRSDAVDLSLVTNNTYGFATVGYGADNSNDSSAIFLFTCYGESFLFTGDASFTSGDLNADEMQFLETDFVESLTDSERIKLSNVSVFLLGHHGSRYSSSSLLLDLINPMFVVVSVGKNNDYGHPHEEVIERINNTKNLSENFLLVTKDCGNISFSSEKGNLVYSYSKFENSSKLTMSWFEFSILIFIVVIYLVVFTKSKSNKQF